MASPTHPGHDNDNVVDLFSRKPTSVPDLEKFIRLSPEHDGLCMLYSNNNSKTDKLYSMRILCWGLRKNGEVVGLVPWLNKILPCNDLEDPKHGQWEGYYDPISEEIFFDPPPHKVAELDTAADYFDIQTTDRDAVIQEIPDYIGTHAMLDSVDRHSLILTEVLSWRLLFDGQIQAMLIDEEKVTDTPVLASDPCLYPAELNPEFRYFFQHHIANQIKSEDPDALAAISLLFD